MGSAVFLELAFSAFSVLHDKRHAKRSFLSVFPAGSPRSEGMCCADRGDLRTSSGRHQDGARAWSVRGTLHTKHYMIRNCM